LWIQKGFSSIQSKWVERAWKLNELAFVKNSKGQIIEGIFKGINSKGGLIIQQAENEEVLYSAQIIR
jgi:biotin-(acetyl-CoA carboxylase) ligase